MYGKLFTPKKKVNDNYDESDNDADSLEDILHDNNDIYSIRPGSVSCFDQLSRKYVGSFLKHFLRIIHLM